MYVTDLEAISAGMEGVVGGKAAGLAAMLHAGERVPSGFCVTTAAYGSDTLPEDEIVAAYERLGGGPVAVRSSATAEDLPDASFAGQQDTVLNVTGGAAVLEAVASCWASLHNARAVAYREAAGIPDDGVAMAVVVQRMVDAEVAGVLFTANPITGSRAEMVVDAARGLGTTVVDGSGEVDHYVLNDDEPNAGGCMDRERLARLRAAGRRVAEHFGSPQDIEWAIDADDTLWLLQSRPITTLFPLPPDTGRPQPRVYFEGGNLQGMLQPFTPMGFSALRVATAQWCDAFGVKADPYDGPPMLADIGGRLYLDLTSMVRSKQLRGRLPDSMAVYGPRVKDALLTVLDDPRFSPQPGFPYRIRSLVKGTAKVVPLILPGTVAALVRPAAARAAMFRMLDQAEQAARPPAGLSGAAEHLRFAARVQRPMMTGALIKTLPPLLVGMVSGQAPAALLKGIAAEGETDQVLGGMPNNITTQMDLALWRLARDAGEHRDLLLNTPPSDLAERYRDGTLPDIGLGAFLDRYGLRGAAEVDVGRPRWAEDPTPVFAAIANYLRLSDPEQAPDRRFERAATQAEAKMAELVRRARRKRPVRARLAGFLMRRARELAGLRELPKFMWLHSIGATRRHLLLAGEDLAERGLLETAEDIMFLDFREALAAADGADQRELVAARWDAYEREMRRRRVPALYLSDGTDVETLATKAPAGDGVLTGMAAAPGTATGTARVIFDPAGAHIEPGEILVAPTTDPGWTPLFMTAGGLVTDAGAPMAHGPTVAREYGIPAVICVRNATQELRTGQAITVDGYTGTITPVVLSG